MYHNKLASVLLIVSVVLNLCSGTSVYPNALTTQKGSASTVSISALSTQDQSGSQDSWNKYVEFYGSDTAYQGTFTYDVSGIDASSVSTFSLDVNLRGPQYSSQVWEFEFYVPASSSWILAGDNTAASDWKWTALSFCGTTDFASLVENGKIQVRFSSTTAYDNCDVDYLAITITVATPTDAPTAAPTTVPTVAATSKPTHAPTAAPTDAPTAAPTDAPTAAPTNAPTAAPTDAPTAAPTHAASTHKPTKAPTSKPTTAPTAAATSKPTSKPTTAPTVAATTKPTTKPTSAPTSGRICPDGEVWAPASGTTWQWQLTGTIDQSIDVQMYDIDMFDNTAETIAELHAAGRAVICYFSTQYENWRPDAASFTSNVLGANLDDWPGEKYVDIRTTTVRNIMTSRLDLAVSKGCDGVEPDNVDEYANTNGLGITAADQLDFNRFIASEAHARGLSVGLKNDLDQVSTLQPNYDWVLDEQCNQYGECDSLTPFEQAGKAVFGVEYSGSASKVCPTMATEHFSWLMKDLNLDASVTQCCTYASGGCATKPAHQCINYNAKRSIPAEVEVRQPAEAEQAQDSAATATLPVVAVAVVAIVALVL